MSLSSQVKILAGAVALALGGTAMGNTTLDTGTTGDVFINVVDTSNNSSFVYDTGLSQAAFLASTSTLVYNFTSDPNYLAFVAGENSGDVLDYSVVSATKTTTTPAVGTVLFTSNAGPSPVIGSSIQNAITNTGAFVSVANGTTSTTSNSALVTGVSNFWGGTTYEQAVATNLGVPYTSPGTGIDALVGTALNFYEETSSALRSGSTYAALSTLTGTWSYVAGVATYSQTSAVPLPTPLLLLLSGLGLMGVVARRGKGTVTGSLAV